MTPAEAAALLGVAAAFDNRKPDADAATAWAMALDRYLFADCRTAIVEYYRKSRDWIMPSDVIDGVKRIHNERERAFGIIPDPPHLIENAREYQRYIHETVQAIRAGTLTRENYVMPVPPELEEAATDERKALIAQARSALAGRSVDDA